MRQQRWHLQKQQPLYKVEHFWEICLNNWLSFTGINTGDREPAKEQITSNSRI